MAYRSIEQKIWQDSKFRELDVNCKLVFIYLITNSHSHYSGLYYMPLQFIEFESGISGKDVSHSIKVLEKTEIIKYDAVNNIVWIINMAKYQCKRISKDLIKGINNHLECLNSQLINEFYVFYANDFN